MVKNRIVSKTALNIASLKDCMSNGFDKFEIHLDKRFCKPITYKEFTEEFKEFNSLKPDVVTVHSPLDYNCEIMKYDNVDLGYILWCQAMQVALCNSFMIASYYADVCGHKVGVNVHISNSLEELEKRGEAEQIFKLVSVLLRQYTDVDLYIENVTPCRKNTNNVIDFRNGHLFEAVDMAEYLNNMLGERRVYTTLDTCHMLISNRVYLTLNNVPPYTDEDYFKAFSKNIKQLHLCYAIGISAKPEHHGVEFGDENADFTKWMNYIQKYMPNADLVLEVREEDYSHHINNVRLKRRIEEFKADET